jgi:hypothetical protein
MKDLLRFDTVVAACALLMSTITAGAMVYQTRVLQDQFSATVWPYLSVSTTYGPTSLAMRVTNQGVGPALIRSAQVSLDGKPLAGWDNAFFSTLFPPSSLRKGSIALRDSSIDPSTAIRAGDQVTLLELHVSNGKWLQDAAAKHRLALDFCYASINGKYWTLHYTPRKSSEEPVAVSRCASTHVISAPLAPFPAH